jgi:NAD+ kinase
VANQSMQKICFVANDTPEASAAAERLRDRYGHFNANEAEVLVALGGDGLMLQTLHSTLRTGLPVYGMNFGSVGFMMNTFSEDDLPARLRLVQRTRIYPLSMTVLDTTGTTPRWRSMKCRCSAPHIKRRKSRSLSMKRPGSMS